jgi:hypothetical protein
MGWPGACMSVFQGIAHHFERQSEGGMHRIRPPSFIHILKSV